MYAILRSGGKQLKVSPGDVVRIERSAGKSPAKGDRLEIGDVLLVSGDDGVRAGSAVLPGVKVMATVLSPVKTRKVLVFKKKKRKQYRRTKGHRQNLIEIRIDGIEG